MKYTRQLNYHQRKRFLFRLRVFFTFLFVLILVAAAWIYYAIVNQKFSNTNAVSTAQSKSYAAPEVKIFNSPYFQLQTNNTWTEIAQETTKNKFVYRSVRGSLVEHELIIYVNQMPDKLTSNRVLPAAQIGDFKLAPENVSDHCIKAAGGSRIDDPFVTINRVGFHCDADSTDYSVLVGLVNGNSSMHLKRPNGTTATYAIRYMNLKALYDDTMLTEMISKFQIR